MLAQIRGCQNAKRPYASHSCRDCAAKMWSKVAVGGKNTIPATVRDLTDAECQEIRPIENLQRADIHELHEAID
jgi:hypothetical protein